jgi:hypothetical protein
MESKLVALYVPPDDLVAVELLRDAFVCGRYSRKGDRRHIDRLDAERLEEVCRIVAD